MSGSFGFSADKTDERVVGAQGIAAFQLLQRVLLALEELRPSSGPSPPG